MPDLDVLRFDETSGAWTRASISNARVVETVDGIALQFETTQTGQFALVGSVGTDINFDGQLDAVDVQLVINAALGLGIGDSQPDVNNDGDINAVDIQSVINAVLGL